MWIIVIIILCTEWWQLQTKSRNKVKAYCAGELWQTTEVRAWGAHFHSRRAHTHTHSLTRTHTSSSLIPNANKMCSHDGKNLIWVFGSWLIAGLQCHAWYFTSFCEPPPSPPPCSLLFSSSFPALIRFHNIYISHWVSGWLSVRYSVNCFSFLSQRFCLLLNANRVPCVRRCLKDLNGHSMIVFGCIISRFLFVRFEHIALRMLQRNLFSTNSFAIFLHIWNSINRQRHCHCSSNTWTDYGALRTSDIWVVVKISYISSLDNCRCHTHTHTYTTHGPNSFFHFHWRTDVCVSVASCTWRECDYESFIRHSNSQMTWREGDSEGTNTHTHTSSLSLGWMDEKE